MTWWQNTNSHQWLQNQDGNDPTNVCQHGKCVHVYIQSTCNQQVLYCSHISDAFKYLIYFEMFLLATCRHKKWNPDCRKLHLKLTRDKTLIRLRPDVYAALHLSPNLAQSSPFCHWLLLPGCSPSLCRGAAEPSLPTVPIGCVAGLQSDKRSAAASILWLPQSIVFVDICGLP